MPRKAKIDEPEKPEGETPEVQRETPEVEAAPPPVTRVNRVSGHELQDMLRQKRREARLREKGY